MSSERSRGGRWNPVRYRWSLVIAATGQVCIPLAAMAGDSLGFVLATVLAVLGIVPAGLLLFARSDRSSADQPTTPTHAVKPAVGRPLVALGTVMIVYALCTVLPIAYPWTRMPLYVAACGGMPIEASNLGYDYDLPTDAGYDPPSIFTTEYFCDAEAAEAAGYQRLP